MVSRAYSILIEPEYGGGFMATVPDLPGCMADGKTQAEALSNIQPAIDSWIVHAHEIGRLVPAPSRDLDEILDRMTPETFPAALDFGGPIGAES